MNGFSFCMVVNVGLQVGQNIHLTYLKPIHAGSSQNAPKNSLQISLLLKQLQKISEDNILVTDQKPKNSVILYIFTIHSIAISTRMTNV